MTRLRLHQRFLSPRSTCSGGTEPSQFAVVVGEDDGEQSGVRFEAAQRVAGSKPGAGGRVQEEGPGGEDQEPGKKGEEDPVLEHGTAVRKPSGPVMF